MPLDEAASLTEYAVSSRYPGEAEDVTEEELSAAIDIAERVFGGAALTKGAEVVCATGFASARWAG
jgi:hypothetical protein